MKTFLSLTLACLFALAFVADAQADHVPVLNQFGQVIGWREVRQQSRCDCGCQQGGVCRCGPECACGCNARKAGVSRATVSSGGYGRATMKRQFMQGGAGCANGACGASAMAGDVGDFGGNPNQDWGGGGMADASMPGGESTNFRVPKRRSR